MLRMWCSVFWWTMWGDQLCADALRPVNTDQGQSLPKVVRYNDQHGVLNVRIRLLDVPSQVTRYEVFGTNVHEPHGPRISFHNGHLVKSNPSEKRTVHIPFTVTLNKSLSRTLFEVSLKANGIFCNTALNRKFLKIVHTQALQSEKECLEKECTITMDWRNECKNIPVVESAPTVTPTKLEKPSYPFAVFTCTSRCRPEEVLVWYQDRGLPEPIVLLINQTYNKYLRDGTIVIKVTINKTLEESDRYSSIYCARRVITDNEDGELVLAYYADNSSGITSQRIALDFDRSIKTDVPKVTVEPGGEFSFEPNTTVEFACSSRLVDGWAIEWYVGDTKSVRRRHLEPILIQSDTVTTSTLKLELNESYDMKSIYCVQEHRSIFYRGNNVSVDFPYGEIARSEVKLRRQTVAGWTSTRTHKLLIAGACVVGALVVLLAGLLVSRRRRRETTEEESDYVTPQVTYAVLALPETDSKAPKKPDKQNYVEIVGVYKDKSENK